MVAHLLKARARLPWREAFLGFDLNYIENRYRVLKRNGAQPIDFAVQLRFKGRRAPLTSGLQIYLTGFQESRIRPESQKITQKVAGKKYDEPAFTLFTLSMFMVDFALLAERPWKATENLPMSCIYRPERYISKMKQMLTAGRVTWRRQPAARKHLYASVHAGEGPVEP
jgi:hypothetical protein